MGIQEQIMARRQEAGLRLAFTVPGRADEFVCYPANEASKAEWLAKAEKLGWDTAESDLWLCSACGSENSEARDYLRCSCCHHAHPYFCGE